MKNVFIKAVNGNHQESIDYLVSLGGKNWSNWRGTAWADSYCIDSKGDVGWVDKNGWRWCAANGYTEVFLPEITSKRHPHYDLIVQWASDISQKVWWSSDKSVWTEIKKPKWSPYYHYYVGENPPPNLEPVLYENTLPHVTYYIADTTKDCLYDLRVNFTEADKHLFDRKLVYYTYEGAVNRANEMLGMTD